DVIVRLLLEKGADVNAPGGYYGNALQAASEGGHDVIVRLLLEKGANVNAQGGRLGSALKAARYEVLDKQSRPPKHRDRELIVNLLLEYGAVDEEEEGQEKKDKHHEEKGDDVGGMGIEGDDSSRAGNGSEDEWASAQEDAEGA
ncbi:hypothetical protein FIBSPDRAFT_730607, partial [Athelia psychrophila]